MPKYARIDDNHRVIVSALRDAGAAVQSLASVGNGCPDLLVGYRGNNHLLEVKDGAKSPSKRRLTPDEMIWHASWKGKVRVVNDIDDALGAIGAL